MCLFILAVYHLTMKQYRACHSKEGRTVYYPNTWRAEGTDTLAMVQGRFPEVGFEDFRSLVENT